MPEWRKEMLRKFEDLMYWMKTGKRLERPSVVESNESSESSDSPYSIQVKEDLLASYGRRWEWRLLRNGKPINHSGVWTQGTSESKRKAVKAGNQAIKEIALHQQNAQQEWENVDTD